MGIRKERRVRKGLIIKDGKAWACVCRERKEDEQGDCTEVRVRGSCGR